MRKLGDQNEPEIQPGDGVFMGPHKRFWLLRDTESPYELASADEEEFKMELTVRLLQLLQTNAPTKDLLTMVLRDLDIAPAEEFHDHNGNLHLVFGSTTYGKYRFVVPPDPS